MEKPDFPVPPGKTVHAYEASPVIEGRILGIGGHLHDYATVLRLEDATDGKVLWEAEPEYDDEGRLTGVSESLMLMTGGIKITPEHTYRIYVEYENPMPHPTPDGGMGEIGGVIWASKDVVWPTVSRDDPIYVADLINTLEAPEKAGGHGEHGGMDHGGMSGMDHGSMSSGTGRSTTGTDRARRRRARYGLTRVDRRRGASRQWESRTAGR